MRGVTTEVHYNKYYPKGVKVFYIDTHKAQHQGKPLDSLSSFHKRKFENMLFLHDPDQIQKEFNYL